MRTLSIRSSLLLLMASVVVPLGGYGAYSIYRDFRQASDRAEQEAMAEARSAASEVEQLLNESRHALENLTQWYETERPGPEACTRRLAAAQDLLPEFFAISVVERSGQLRCTGGPLTVDPDTLPPPPDRAWLREVLETGSFVVSRPVVGRFSREWISVLALPLRGPEGSLEAAIAGSIDARIFERAFEHVALPEGGVITLSHAEGIVIARSEESARYVGTRLPEGGIAPEELLARSGFNRATALEGGEHLWAWSPLPAYEWIVFAGLPVEEIYAPIRRSAIERGLVLMGIFLLAGLFAAFLYRRLSGSLELLAADSRTATEGSGARIRQQGPREVREVARQFNESLEAREEAERELRRAEEKLREREKMEAVGRLAGGIAHDFNNLLTVVRGEASLLDVELSSDFPAARRSVEQISRASDRAAELVGQLLAFSGQPSLSPTPVNLGPTVRDLSESIRSVLGSAIDLEIEVDPEVGSVRIDRGELEEVFLHLALNARDAMPHGGTFRIEAAALAQPGERGSGEDSNPSPGRRTRQEPPGGWVLIRVTDTGEGMMPQVQERAFEPFYTTKTRQRGTGLGLSTVYGIVSRIGGEVTLESEAGEGTTVTIRLPREPGQSSTGERGRA